VHGSENRNNRRNGGLLGKLLNTSRALVFLGQLSCLHLVLKRPKDVPLARAGARHTNMGLELHAHRTREVAAAELHAEEVQFFRLVARVQDNPGHRPNGAVSRECHLDTLLARRDQLVDDDSQASLKKLVPEYADLGLLCIRGTLAVPHRRDVPDGNPSSLARYDVREPHSNGVDKVSFGWSRREVRQPWIQQGHVRNQE